MAEQNEKKPKSLRKMAMVILGLALIILGMLAVIRWWGNLWYMLQGSIGLILFLAGIGVIILARE